MSKNQRKRRTSNANPYRPLLYGALAGAAATVLMTGTMRRLFETLPEDEQYPLPPREIVDSTRGDATPEPAAGEEAATATTMALHFGYGAATGALFALQRRRSIGIGAVYGLAVWAGSYLGWIPAAGILKPATRHPWRRNLLMNAAHLAWGAMLAKQLGEIEKADSSGIFNARKKRRDIAP